MHIAFAPSIQPVHIQYVRTRTTYVLERYSKYYYAKTPLYIYVKDEEYNRLLVNNVCILVRQHWLSTRRHMILCSCLRKYISRDLVNIKAGFIMLDT